MPRADDLAGDTLRVGRTFTSRHELTDAERAAIDRGELALAGDGAGSMQLMRAPSEAKRRETWQRALTLGRRVREHRSQPAPKIAPAPPRVRTARPRGGGRPRASASRSRSSARSGDSGDSSGSSEGGEPPGLAALPDGAGALPPCTLGGADGGTPDPEPAQNSRRLEFWTGSCSCGCGASLEGRRAGTRYFTGACRVRAHRARRVASRPLPPVTRRVTLARAPSASPEREAVAA